MANKQGTLDITDSYINGQPVEARYIGSVKYHDPYSEVSGSLPLVYESRVAHILQNYLLHGTSEGAGVETVNLFDLRARNTSNGYVAGLYLKSDGTTADSTACYITEYIAVAPSTTYTLYRGTTSGSSLSVCEYDANKEYVRGTPYNSRTAVTITTRQDTAYIRASIYYVNVLVTMLTEGSTAPDHFIPYGYSIPLTVTGGNLFNSSGTNTTKGYIYHKYLTSTGNVYDSANASVSEYISVTPGATYSLINATTSANYYHVFYNANKTVLIGSAFNTATSTIVTVPANARYLRATVNDSKWDTFRICCVDDYPLYIGSTRLGEEEYLDYGEQKVYKFTGNVFDKNDPSQQYRGYTFDTEQGKWFKYTGSAVCFRIPCAPSTSYRVNLGFIVPSIRLGQLKTSEVPQEVDMSVDVSDAQTLRTKDSCYVTTEADTLYILLQFTGTSTIDVIDNLAVMPLTPTDPPIALPTISTYQGENTLSSTETLGTVTVKGRINTPST